jgi:PEP-CTERM motif-containing protein
MRLLKTCVALAVAAAVSAGVTSGAQAGYVFVGSWTVDQGPNWTTGPIAYTGQAAAALLFGGLAADYAISVADSNPVDITFTNWISTYGVSSGEVVAETYRVANGGRYNTFGDTSAYVQDNAIGARFTNFAFVQDVPEPMTLAILGSALAGLGLVRRRV